MMIKSLYDQAKQALK